MNYIYSIAVFTFGMAAAAAQAQDPSPVSVRDYEAGLSTLAVLDDRSDRDLEGLVWYPTDTDGPMRIDFESAVWLGSAVVRDATSAPGSFPLIVLSHGMFGNSRNQAWFGAEMARRGFVVAAIDHPGTSTWSRDPDQRRELWERPGDITRLIDLAVSPGALPAQVQPDQIFMAGHSLGGFTALALAGARYNAKRIKQFCDATPGDLVCGIFSDWKIAQTPDERDRMQGDLSDGRIRAFAVFDLGGTQSFSDESLRSIDRPLLVFGAPIMNSGLTLDIESRALVQALQPRLVRYVEPPTLTHFDFFNLCKPDGYAILAEEIPGDEIICEDGRAHRADMHELILDEVTAFFWASLQ